MRIQGKQNLRVAVVAENASFRFGGEASLPLHYFARLRQRGVDAWLIVHGRTRAELDLMFPFDRHRILTIDDQWFHKLLWWPSKMLPGRVYAAIFGTVMESINSLLQREMVRDLVLKHGIDVVHQPTPVSPRAPSFMAGLDAPVVIGPMNGGMEYPDAFRQVESALSRGIVALGRSAANVVNRIIPGKKDAEILLVANERTERALPGCVRGTVLQVPENGVDLKVWTAPHIKSSVVTNAAPRFLFIGRLVEWKRLDLALRSLAQVPDATLEVIGDGAMRAQWSALAETLGIADRVKFVGWLPQPECAQRLQDATALLLPSILECGGAVVLEAMACGAPVIATNWGGPADYLTPHCGILVDTASEQTIIDGFAAAMTKLAADPALRNEMGADGRERVEHHFDWDQKIERILAVYRQAMQMFADKQVPGPSKGIAVPATPAFSDAA